MQSYISGIPEPGEYSPGFAGYIARAAAFDDPVHSLSTQMNQFLAMLSGIDERKRGYRYADGKWSVKEVLGHIIDCERIFAYRALRIGRGDQTPLPSFDENDYGAAAQSDRCDWHELIEEFEVVRRASILMLKHLPDEAWVRRGTVSGGPMSVRAVAYVMIGHVAHHSDILRERYL